MSIVLTVVVYTANRGYAWSSVPKGMTAEDLEGLLKLATAARPEFPTERDVSSGAVSDGRLIAVYTIRTVPAWDAEGRSAEYAAFVLVDREVAPEVDFTALLGNRVLTTPLRTPPPFILYDGPSSAAPALDVAGKLLSRNHLVDFPFAAAGALLGKYADRCSHWTLEANAVTGRAEVKTSAWHAPKKNR